MMSKRVDVFEQRYAVGRNRSMSSPAIWKAKGLERKVGLFGFQWGILATGAGHALFESHGGGDLLWPRSLAIGHTGQALPRFWCCMAMPSGQFPSMPEGTRRRGEGAGRAVRRL